MKKYILDLTVRGVERLSEKHVLIRLTSQTPLPEMLPGQFVEVRVDGSQSTFLRRPISINFVDREHNELWLMVAMIGEGTRRLGCLQAGDVLNCVLPLGNGFTIEDGTLNIEHDKAEGVANVQCSMFNLQCLLVGGGVGMAPMLFLGATLHEMGMEPTFLLGGRTAADLLELDLFRKFGRVCVTTEDGSMGEQGFVTNHSVLADHFDRIYTCGPTPMMKAVARYAREHAIDCEASLENMMACGLGACLCCVEKVRTDESLKSEVGCLKSDVSPQTTNVCVCKEGPVFNINRLLW